MDIIHAKGSGFFNQGKITLMNPIRMIDMVKTEQRYQEALVQIENDYLKGMISLAEKQQLTSQAEYDRIYMPIMKNIQNQRALEKARVQPVDHKQEQGYLVNFNSIDFEIGTSNNNFELKLNKEQSMLLGIELGDYVFSPDTEFGGIIEGRTIDTATNELIWTGTTWRGLLMHDVIRPKNPKTEAFRVVSGDINAVLREILAENSSAGSFFSVPETAAGTSISNYQFPRYIGKLQGLTAMLESVGYKLRIWTDNGEAGGSFSVWCSAVPIANYSNEIEYSQDTNKIDVKMTEDYSAINHLICLGDGELTERTVIDLYVNKEGSISQTKPADGYLGVHERIAVYDYGSVEGETKEEKRTNLLTAGIKQLQELNKTNSMELTVNDIPAEIGDIIAGRDRTTGMKMQKAITTKILRIDAEGIETIELNVNGNEVEAVEYN